MLTYFSTIIILLTSFYICFKVYFYKNDKTIINILNIFKFISISVMISIISYFLIEFMNSDSNFKMFNEVKISFIIIMIASIYITFAISTFKNGLFISEYRRIKKSYFGILYYFTIIFATSFTFLFFNLNDASIFKILLLPLIISILFLFIYFSFESNLIHLALSFSIIVPFLIFIMIKEHFIGTKFYFLITLLFSILILFFIKKFIFSIKKNQFKKIIINQIKKINYGFDLEKNSSFLKKFHLHDFDGDLLNLYLCYDNKKDNIKYFLRINIEKQIINILNDNEKKFWRLNFNLKGNVNIKINDVMFYYANTKKTRLHLNIIEEPENLSDYLLSLSKINDIFVY